MAQLFIITEDWTEQTWFSTGGTRAKKYLQSPDGKFYYFKRSQIKPGREYTFEFWNEIIAYELGSMVGFNILRYDIAVDGKVMGCICESMIDSENEELIEGVKYLQAYSPTYDPAKKAHQSWYTFDLIERALKSAKIEHFIDEIIKTIIFDSLIGNGDRHQENWALISKQQLITDILTRMEKEDEAKFPKIVKRTINWLKKNLYEQKNKGEKIPGFLYDNEIRFAPIYDSGSSLGRELLEEKVNLYIDDEQELNRYIERGVSEIHWNSKKINHFALIANLLGSSYKGITEDIIKDITTRFNGVTFGKIINEIDIKVPESLGNYKIPDNRKQLIIKMITLRLEKLKALLHEGI